MCSVYMNLLLAQSFNIERNFYFENFDTTMLCADENLFWKSEAQSLESSLQTDSSQADLYYKLAIATEYVGIQDGLYIVGLLDKAISIDSTQAKYYAVRSIIKINWAQYVYEYDIAEGCADMKVAVQIGLPSYLLNNESVQGILKYYYCNLKSASGTYDTVYSRRYLKKREVSKLSDSVVAVCNEIAQLQEFSFNVYKRIMIDSASQVLYTKLYECCDEWELFSLTKHKSAMVKVFSYCALLEQSPHLFVHALQMNKADTATVLYRNGISARMLMQERSAVSLIAKQFAYYAYVQDIYIAIFDDKDWKYIENEHRKLLQNLEDNFERKIVTVKGKLLNAKFGAIINLDNGGMFYVKDKPYWDDSLYGEYVEITGETDLKTFFRTTERYESGELVFRSHIPEFVKSIEVHSLTVVN